MLFRVALTLFLGVSAIASPPATGKTWATSSSAVAATVHPLATDAAMSTFEQGGNAVDAAVAAALTLGVVDSFNSGLGGGCFLLARLANGQVIALDGREMAPAASTREMFFVDGKADTRLSQTGPLAVGIPGALAAYEHAIANYGNRTLAQALLPAAELAEDGFPLGAAYARNIRRTKSLLTSFPGSREVYFDASGQPHAAGSRFRQLDLARTYRAIAEKGTDWFYRGPFAQHVGAWMAQHGGRVTEDDFANYEVRTRTPIRIPYRQYEVLCFPPPSSGGVHLAQMLNILETYPLGDLYRDDPRRTEHLLGETMKLAFADRAYWLGDADFAPVPRGLISKPYARQLATQINLDRAQSVAGHGTPAAATTDVFGKHTTHIATADAQGNWVAITATINTTFGSKIIVPGTGIILNNEMDDFSIQPGVPNAFGLVGAENNAVAPGKRPLSSMSPTIVLQDGEPILSVGAAGGPKIITQALLGVVRCLDFGDTLPEALERKRLHHQWRPDSLMVERGTDDRVVRSLLERGHTVSYLGSAGVSQGVRRLPDGRLLAAHDPRVAGKAAGLAAAPSPSSSPPSR